MCKREKVKILYRYTWLLKRALTAKYLKFVRIKFRQKIRLRVRKQKSRDTRRILATCVSRRVSLETTNCKKVERNLRDHTSHGQLTHMDY